MIKLHYEIRFCQKIVNRVIMTVYVKCVVRFNVNNTLQRFTIIYLQKTSWNSTKVMALLLHNLWPPPWNAWDEWRAKSLGTRPSWLPGLFLKSKEGCHSQLHVSTKNWRLIFSSVTKLFPEWKLLLISSNRVLQVRIF